MSKNMILSAKYSQKILDRSKQSAKDAVKTISKGEIEKTAEVADNLLGNEMANKITEISKTSQQNSLKAIESETKNRNTKKNIYILRKKTKSYF